MDKEFDSKKQNTPTPRRSLGLSRISPRTTITPPTIKRPISDVKHNVPSTSKTKESAGNVSEVKEDVESFATPTKKRKCLGRFVFTPKQTNDPVQEKCTDVKSVVELKAEISQMKAHLDKYEQYKVKKNELEQLIEKWSAGGKRALRQLQEEIKPQQDLEQILTHLRIPADIFGDVTNDE